MLYFESFFRLPVKEQLARSEFKKIPQIIVDYWNFITREKGSVVLFDNWSAEYCSCYFSDFGQNTMVRLNWTNYERSTFYIHNKPSPGYSLPEFERMCRLKSFW